MSELLRVTGLKKSFRAGFWLKKVDAIVDVGFSVNKGEIFGIVGPNGAGKTTTIKILAGLIKPDGGTITVEGADGFGSAFKSKLGYLPENPYFYEHLKVGELLAFYGQLHGIDRQTLNKRVPQLIERVGLTHATDRRLSKFSKGMRQRAGLAQALINDPEVVILDEPQTGLDPFGRKDVRDIIFDLKEKGKTVIFSSHILPDVEAVCDRVVIFHKGRTIESGTLLELTGAGNKGFEIIAHGVTKTPSLAQIKSEQGGNVILQVETEAGLQEVLRELLSNGATVSSVTSKAQDLEDVLVRDMRKSE